LHPTVGASVGGRVGDVDVGASVGGAVHSPHSCGHCRLWYTEKQFSLANPPAGTDIAKQF